MSALNRWQVGIAAGVVGAAGAAIGAYLMRDDREMGWLGAALGAAIGASAAAAITATTPNGVSATTPAQVTAANAAAQALATAGA